MFKDPTCEGVPSGPDLLRRPSVTGAELSLSSRSIEAQRGRHLAIKGDITSRVTAEPGVKKKENKKKSEGRGGKKKPIN